MRGSASSSWSSCRVGGDTGSGGLGRWVRCGVVLAVALRLLWATENAGILLKMLRLVGVRGDVEGVGEVSVAEVAWYLIGGGAKVSLLKASI